jgi:hypothetical protein
VSGNLTVTGGEARNDVFDPVGPMDVQNYTNIGNFNPPAGQTIRFDFASLVSAVGFSVHYNNSPVSFQLFNSFNVLLDSFLGSPTDFGSITGYIGLDVGTNSVAYALLDVPAVSGHNMYVDNIVYQASASPVPEPATLSLLGLGLAGAAVVRYRRRR